MKVVASIRQRSFARFVAFDLADAARRLGWAVHWIDFDAHTQQLAGAPPERWLEVLDAITHDVRAFGPDLIFSYGIEAILPPFPAALPESRWCVADEARVPVACFFYDFGAPFDRPLDAFTTPVVERLQRADVRVFCWDHAALSDLSTYGVAAEYLPMAVNDAMFHPPASTAVRDIPVLFSGGPTPTRVAALRPLASLGLSIYGYDEAGWTADPVLAPHYRGFVPERDRLRELYQRTRVAPNVTRAHGRASLNMRVFEVMACGGLVVTDQAEEAARLFEPDRDLVTIAPDADLAAAVGPYLVDETRRARVADRGAATVRERHTYVERIGAITPRLKAFVSETRAWPFWEQFVAADPARALRFTEALRADRTLLRDDLWHLADATALVRLGRWDLARLAAAEAASHNPALLALAPLQARLGTH